MNYMKKNILLSLILVCAVACVGKVDLPEYDTPPHLQGTEQEGGKDEGEDDGKTMARMMVKRKLHLHQRLAVLL